MKPFNTQNSTYATRTRSSQRRITANKTAITRTDESVTDLILLPEDEQLLYDNLNKLTNEITKTKLQQEIRNNLSDIFNKSKLKQKENESYKLELENMNQELKNNEYDIKSLKSKEKDTQTNLNELIQEGDKQIKELTNTSNEQCNEIKQLKTKIQILEQEIKEQEELNKTNNEQCYEITQLKTKIQTLVKEIKEQKELIKTPKEECEETRQLKIRIQTLEQEIQEQKEQIEYTEEENNGLSLAVASLNNAISHGKRKSSGGRKPLFGFNNSLNFSLFDQSSSSSKSLPNEIDKTDTYKNVGNHENKGRDKEENTDTTTINKSKDNTTKPGKNENIQELGNLDKYVTPEIVILNDRKLQTELENENILNKNKGKADKSNKMDSKKRQHMTNQDIDAIEILETSTRRTSDAPAETLLNLQSGESANNRDVRPNKDSGSEKLLNIDMENMEQLKRKITEIEKKTNQNTHKIQSLECNLHQGKTDVVSKTKQQSTEHKKTNCYLIGDSHLRHVEKEIMKDTEWTSKFNPKINFVPGYQIQDIVNELIPKELNKEDILVFCGGSNDLYHTSTDEIKKQINIIGGLGCTTFIISVPPQHYDRHNYNINGLNTVIKYECEKYKNLFLINTHKFVQPHHLARDGIHLGQKAKKWLSSKIMKTVEKYSSEPYNRPETVKLSSKHTHGNKKTTENSYSQTKNRWTAIENQSEKTGRLNLHNANKRQNNNVRDRGNVERQDPRPKTTKLPLKVHNQNSIAKPRNKSHAKKTNTPQTKPRQKDNNITEDNIIRTINNAPYDNTQQINHTPQLSDIRTSMHPAQDLNTIPVLRPIHPELSFQHNFNTTAGTPYIMHSPYISYSTPQLNTHPYVHAQNQINTYRQNFCPAMTPLF